MQSQGQHRAEGAAKVSGNINAPMGTSATAGSPGPRLSQTPVVHPGPGPNPRKNQCNVPSEHDGRDDIANLNSGIMDSTPTKVLGGVAAPCRLDATIITDLANSSTPTANPGIINKSQAAASTEPADKHLGPGGQKPGAASSEATGEAKMPPSLEELLQANEELKLWLDMTNYFDLEHRKKVLLPYKKLATIEKEKKKLMEEIQKSSPIFTVPGCSYGPPISNKGEPAVKYNNDDGSGLQARMKDFKPNNRGYQAKTKQSSDRYRSRSPGWYDSCRSRDQDDRNYERSRCDRHYYSPASSHPPFDHGQSHTRSRSPFVPPRHVPLPERPPSSGPLADRIKYNRDGDSHDRYESGDRAYGTRHRHRKLDLGRKGGE